MADRAIGEHALLHLAAHVARDDGREIARQAPGFGAIAAAHFQHVAEALGGDQPDARNLPFEQRIGADRRAMHDGAEISDPAEHLETVKETHGLIAAIGRHFRGAKLARFAIHQEEIGEGAADIDTNDARTTHHEAFP